MKFVENSNKTRSLRNVHQYIFPILCNTLRSKISKNAISDVNYRRDVSLCIRVNRDNKKENDKKKM